MVHSSLVYIWIQPIILPVLVHLTLVMQICSSGILFGLHFGTVNVLVFSFALF